MGCGSSVVTPYNAPNYSKSSIATTKPAHNTLEEVLRHDDTSKKFMDFLSNDHSLENLQFVLDVKNYNETVQQAKDMARQIFTKYIEPNSEREVNLSRQMREDIRTRMTGSGVSEGLFAGALNEIQYSIETDSLPRFFLTQQKGYASRFRSPGVRPEEETVELTT